MAEKVTVMVLKVDLQCPCCYKKVKKILCKFPQIRDQVYNEKANTVTITVVCCNPEKLRDKLCCKGAKVIKSIEIVEPQKPKKPEKQLEKPKDQAPHPVKPAEKPKDNPKSAPPPAPASKPPPVVGPCPDRVPDFPVRTCCGSCYEGRGGGPCYQGYHGHVEKPPKIAPPPPPAPAPNPPPVVGPYPDRVPDFPVRTCCGSCYEGRGGGPCYQEYYGFGVPLPPQPSFDGYNYGYGHGGYDRSCHVSRCGSYFSEENPHSCAIM